MSEMKRNGGGGASKRMGDAYRVARERDL